MTSLKLLCTFLAYIFSSNGRATFREELLIRLNPFADEHWFWQSINSICHHFSQILICIGVVCHAQNFAQYKFRIYWSLPFQWERGWGNHLVDDMERRYKDYATEGVFGICFWYKQKGTWVQTGLKGSQWKSWNSPVVKFTWPKAQLLGQCLTVFKEWLFIRFRCLMAMLYGMSWKNDEGDTEYVIKRNSESGAQR